MADTNKKIITVNWQAVGRFLRGAFLFLKWPVTLIGITYLIVPISDWQKFRIDWELLLKYIRVLIWPLVVVWGLKLLRPNLPGLMSRLEELSLPGGNAKFAKAQNQNTDTQGEELKEISPDASEPNTKTANDFQITDDDTHALLTSYDAAVAYTQVYTDIFGTQIEALRRLVDYTDGLKRDDFADILKEHEDRSGEKGFNNIVPFMQYLLHNTLVRYDEQAQTYQLTIAGFYFLVFLHKAELLERPKQW